MQVGTVLSGLDGGRPHVRDGSVVQVVEEGLLHDAGGTLGVVADDEGHDEPGSEGLDGRFAEVGAEGNIDAVEGGEGEVLGNMLSQSMCSENSCFSGRGCRERRGKSRDIVHECHRLEDLFKEVDLFEVESRWLFLQIDLNSLHAFVAALTDMSEDVFTVLELNGCYGFWLITIWNATHRLHPPVV